MKTITIIGSEMMGSALAFPARENGNTVRLVGTPLDREIIDTCRKTGRDSYSYILLQIPLRLLEKDGDFCSIPLLFCTWAV
jgi:glycerol-3-phosphate dehydrogenase